MNFYGSNFQPMGSSSGGLDVVYNFASYLPQYDFTTVSASAHFQYPRDEFHFGYYMEPFCPTGTDSTPAAPFGSEPIQVKEEWLVRLFGDDQNELYHGSYSSSSTGEVSSPSSSPSMPSLETSQDSSTTVPTVDSPTSPSRSVSPYQVHQRQKRVTKEERRYQCDFPGCGALFGRRYTLDCHRFVHSDVKPYPCDYPNCTKSFSQNQALIVHKRNHTGERPFPCTINGCDAKFVTKHKLQRHINGKHLKLRPFACSQEDCGWAFTEVSALRKHMATHTSEELFECPTCALPFRQKSSMLRHAKNAHDGSVGSDTRNDDFTPSDE